MRIIVHDGEAHTLTDWAKKIGISRNALTNRLRRGWSIERALSGALPHGKRPKLIEGFGRQLTIAEWAKRLSYHPSSLYKHLKNGKTIEEIARKGNCQLVPWQERP